MAERKPPALRCPGCGAALEWREDNPWRPFCSRRCRDEDFCAWASGARVIPGNAEESELFSEDPPPR